jgi:drug/metabolite transporter (DMT)-like permease
VIALAAGRPDDLTMSNRTLVPTFVLLWASGYVVGDLAIQAADPVPLLAVRFTLGVLAAAPLALRHGRWRGAPLGRLAVIGLLLQVTQFGGAYTGFSMGVPAGVSALVMLGLSPLVTTALSIAGGHERGDRRVWIGLVIGLGGVFIGLIPTLADAKLGTGLLFTFAAMLGLAGGTVLQKRWTADVDPRVSAAVQSGTAALIFVPLAVILGGRFDLGPKLIASGLWLGIGMSVGALIVFVTLVRRMDASRVGALLLLVPAVTAIASWPALGESLHPLTFVGMVVAAAGVGTVLRRRQEPAAPGAAGVRATARREAEGTRDPKPAAPGVRAAARRQSDAARDPRPAAPGVRAAPRRQPQAARDPNPAAPGVRAAARRQSDAARDPKPAPTGTASGIVKICPGQPSTSNVPVGSNP